MSSSTSLRDQQRVVVALLNRASTTHRLTILDQLVSDASSPFELIAERSLRLTLPKDDDLLRSLLSSEIETHGEAETLVRWALKFTATTSFFFVLQLKSAEEGPRSQNVGDLFMTDYAPQLWEKYGQDEIYVSPHHAAAEMQVELLFPDSAAEAPVDTLTLQTESVPAPEAPGMMHTVSSSSEGGGSGFSQASALSSASTAATSIVSPTRPQSRASLVHPTSSTAFKARAIPNTVKSRPSIEPRLSKAAALRMGVQLPDSPASSSQSRKTGPSKDAAAAANIGISSVTKRPVAPPVSLKAPSIAPRLNKAALARQGGSSEAGHAAVTRRPASAAGHVFPSTSGGTGQARPRKQVDFSTTPGHKRLSLVGQSSIASIAPPSIAPQARGRDTRGAVHAALGLN
ncbi:hypothetical protein [Sporisorium scitamineum]|uniref:Uncharacterized protein n=1 Tax=Sporisorium scitamineum TaxID=49012 RepID=A0A0F7RXE9_9BASI|nr:hypothetical protein [Sporisorium scitamineum]